jgi:hypothetical protein
MNAASEVWVDLLRQKVARMRFGSVHVTIHEGRVTQIESTEKTRVPNEPESLTDRPEPEGNLHSASHRSPGARGRK